MREMTLEELAEGAGGRVVPESAGSRRIKGVFTDSRRPVSERCFVALQGDKFDGHDFVAAALDGGATAAMVRSDFEPPAGGACVQVEDPLRGLQRLASWFRGTLEIPIIAVVGSNGKTSTKEMIAAALGARFRTAKTQGNLNNHIGVPLTLLSIDPGVEAAVIEIGTNHPGEIAELAALVRPTIGVLTNIGHEHLEFLKDLEGVAKEEGTLLEALDARGTAILNADDLWTPRLRQRTAARVVEAGFNERAQIRVEQWEATERGSRFAVRAVPFEIPLAGRHMAGNAALAIAAGEAAGVSLEAMAEALKSVALPGGRMRVLARGDVQLIDDCYNANPSSMQAALRQLGASTGRTIAVLGTMGELGADEAAWHEKVGRWARENAINELIAVGPFAVDYVRGFGGGHTFGDVEGAVAWLSEALRPGDRILVKASRSARFERVVAGLGFNVAEAH